MPLRKVERLAAAALLLVASAPAPAAEMITRPEWPRLKQGVNVIQLPVLQRLVNEYEHSDRGRIVIRYPGGDRGDAWAVELRDWLVALGISSRHISLEPGSGIPATMVVYVESSKRP
jgi:hypothetical protein